jgi:hypothetical protein
MRHAEVRVSAKEDTSIDHRRRRKERCLDGEEKNQLLSRAAF